MNDKYKNTNAKQISTAKPDDKLPQHWLMMLGLLLAVFFGQALMTKAATYTVTNTSNSGAGSLRDAINQANAASSNDVITFDPTIFAAHQTITLGGTELVIQNNGSLTIDGPATGVTISGNNASRVLLNSGAAVSLQNLTITGGAQGSGPVIHGAGIYNAGGTMTLTKVTVSGNTASSGLNGGGIYNAGGTMTLTNSTISNNSARRGGGIRNIFGGTLTLNDSTISGNSAGYSGGGIDNYESTATLTNTTVSGNSSTFGGGFLNVRFNINFPALMTVSGSTISNNTAQYGAGIFNQGASFVMSNATVSGNVATASDGGGGGLENEAYNFDTDAAFTNCTFFGNQQTSSAGPSADDIYSGNGGKQSTVTLRNTIVAGSSATTAPNMNVYTDGTIAALGAIISQGYNISSDAGGGFLTGTGDQINTNPQLAPLANNGGPTLTHALLPGSPAIDKGNSFGLTTDQRGFARPVDFPLPNAPGGDGSDIGAFEAGKEQCKNGGWTILGNGTFRNQGDCIQFVNTGK